MFVCGGFVLLWTSYVRQGGWLSNSAKINYGYISKLLDVIIDEGRGDV